MTRWPCSCGEQVVASNANPHPDGLYVMSELRYGERAAAKDFNLVAESARAHLCRACGRLAI